VVWKDEVSIAFNSGSVELEGDVFQKYFGVEMVKIPTKDLGITSMFFRISNVPTPDKALVLLNPLP
jgi:hypothetical protein